MQEKDVLEKYIAPGIIVPLQTNVWRDFTIGATFIPPHNDLGMSATFSNAAHPITAAQFGTVLAVGSNNTANILSFSVGVGAYISGFQFSGDGDGIYLIYKNGKLFQRFTTNIMVPNIDYKIPSPMQLVVGDVIQVVVVNTSSSTCDYQATCFGSFP